MPLHCPLLPRVDDELPDLLEREPVEAPDLENPAAGDLRRHEARDLRRRRVRLVVEIGCAMHDQRRRLDRRERAPHIDVHVHAAQRQQGARAHRQTCCARPFAHHRIGRRLAEAAREGALEIRAALKLGEPALGPELVLLARRRPREVGSADETRFALEQHDREDPLRVRCCEEDRQRRTVDVAEERGALDADGVHHRAHVVHALLERGHAADAIGCARASLVEADDAHAPRQLVEPGADRLVVELDRRKVETAREDEIERPHAEDAVGDVNVAALCVSSA